MSYVSDKLWDGYLRTNMSIILTKVKVREIIPHLPCLTTHDRENIEAKRETYGNYDAMTLLLECLRRRDNWPEQFIAGLEACEQPIVASEMRAAYNALIGVNSSIPRPPQANVEAHVPPAPAARPVRAGTGQAAVAPPTLTPPAVNNPEPAAQDAPTNQHAPQNAAVFPPAAVPEPSQSSQDPVPLLPSTPPPSPETLHAEVAKAPQPQEQVHPHQKPEENSESDIQDVSGGTSLTPIQASSGNKKVPLPQRLHPAPTCETDPSPCPDPLQIPVTTNNKPPQSPSPAQVNLGLSDGSSVLIMTPEKLPVQDTAPPVHKVPSAAEISKPAAPQIVKSNVQTEPAATASAESHDDDDETVCLSKPDQLISFYPVNHSVSPDADSHPPAEPYSGNSERLELSEAASAPSCHLNSTANHNEPEENHYESPNQSFEVTENVVRYAEMPSVPNLDGQATESHHPTDGSISKPPGFINADNNAVNMAGYNPSEPPSDGVSPELKSQPNSERNTVRQSNTRKYFLIAAGVGVVMLMMARRFRK